MAIGNEGEFEGAVKPSSIEKDAYDNLIHAARTVEIPSNLQMRTEYASGQPLYIGYAARGVGAGDEGWLIHKITLTSGLPTLRQIAYASWNLRADGGTVYA